MSRPIEPQPRADGRLVWTGRFTGASNPGRDGWNTPRSAMRTAVENASELVVVDPLSFPWRTLGSRFRSLPIAAQLPDELSAAELSSLLKRVLLRHVTAFDRLHEARPEVRRALEAEFGLDPGVWVEEPLLREGGLTLRSDTDLGAAGLGKERLYQVVQMVREEIGVVEERSGPLSYLTLVGRAGLLGGPLESSLRIRVQRRDAAGADPSAIGPLAVVWLEDGGLDPEQRRRALATGLASLHPSDRLLVLASVVNTGTEQHPNPSISDLVGELSAAAAGMVTITELRSFTWAGEQLTRGVLLGADNLSVGRI